MTRRKLRDQEGLRHGLRFQRIYKYQIDEDAIAETPLRGYSLAVEGEWVRLQEDGKMIFRRGYSYDGASGPTIDTADSMGPALMHDGGYQLIAEAGLPRSERKALDKHFRTMLKENGMGWFRRNLWYWGVSLFGRFYV